MTGWRVVPATKADAGELLVGRRPQTETVHVAQVPVPDRRVPPVVPDGDRHLHGAVGADQVVEVVREVPQGGRPVVLLLCREQIEEGREVVDRPRLQVPVQQLAELRDRIDTACQQVVAAVVSCRASQDRPGQSTRP